jgi:hypothetical protein
MIYIFKTFRKSKIYEYYYVIILFVVLTQLYFIPSIRLGVVTSVIILLVLNNTINRQDLLRNTFINKLVLAYIFYNSVSIILYIFYGIPLSVFFAEWSNSILPIFFFYLSSKEKTESFRFYNLTLIVLIININKKIYKLMIQHTTNLNMEHFNIKSENNHFFD